MAIHFRATTGWNYFVKLILQEKRGTRWEVELRCISVQWIGIENSWSIFQLKHSKSATGEGGICRAIFILPLGWLVFLWYSGPTISLKRCSFLEQSPRVFGSKPVCDYIIVVGIETISSQNTSLTHMRNHWSISSNRNNTTVIEHFWNKSSWSALPSLSTRPQVRQKLSQIDPPPKSSW